MLKRKAHEAPDEKNNARHREAVKRTVTRRKEGKDKKHRKESKDGKEKEG